MGRKILSLLIPVILLLAIILFPLGKVKAQAIVILAFAVIGIGEGERAEIYYSHPGAGPAAPIPRDRLFFNYHHFVNVTTTLPLPAPGEEACTETVQTTVKGWPGINVLTLEMGEGNDSLLVNGEEVPLMESCFEDAKRVVFELGIQPPRSVQTQASNQDTTPAGFPSFLGATVVGNDGSTAAAFGSRFAQDNLGVLFNDPAGQ